MEKYEKLFRGLEMCAGPECCKDGCPYYGESRGGKTCRAWLLNDAATTIAAKEAENQALAGEVNRIAVERDKLNENITCIIRDRDDMAEARDALRKECTSLRERCQVQQSEIDALVLKLGKKGGQEPTPGLEKTMECALKATMQAEYWRGQANALKDFLHFYCGGQTVEDVSLDLPDMHGEPEPEATDNPKQTDELLGT